MKTISRRQVTVHQQHIGQWEVVSHQLQDMGNTE
jgi:hypothetical protein